MKDQIVSSLIIPLFSFRWKILTIISLIFNSVFLYNMLAPQEVGRLGGVESVVMLAKTNL